MPRSLSKFVFVVAGLATITTARGASAQGFGKWTTQTTPAGVSLPAPRHPAQLGFVDRLTLGEAVSRTLAYNPSMRAAQHEIEARDGEAFQVSRRPNPELIVDIENFGGSKDKKGFDAAEETASLTQLIELGGKRMLRLQAAQLDTSLATWDFEAVRVQMATLAAQSFVDVLTVQERIKVLGEFVSIAEKTRKSVEARVQAGQASPIELDRADIARGRAKALRSAEEVRLEAGKRRVSTLWGVHTVDFRIAVGRLGNGFSVPSVDTLKTYLNNNPTLARWSDEVSRRSAQLDLEYAKAIPDIRVGAGVRQFNENDSTAIVASVAIPLPIFDRNDGNIAAAERRIAKAEADALATRDELLRTLIEAVGDLEVAASQLRTLKQEVLPKAETAYERTKLGYDAGKFDLLNVLDVQRSVFEVRLDLLNARADYEKARVRVEALIGLDITTLSGSATK